MRRLLRNRIFVIASAVLAVVATLRLTRGRSREFGPLPDVVPIERTQTDSDANVYLYIANRAFVPDEIDLCVSIDGVDVVRDTFKIDLQVTHTRYQLSITPGQHLLAAQTIRGQAKVEQKIDIKDELHVGVSFYYSEAPIFGQESPPTLTCHTQDEPWIPDWAWKDGDQTER